METSLQGGHSELFLHFAGILKVCVGSSLCLCNIVSLIKFPYSCKKKKCIHSDDHDPTFLPLNAISCQTMYSNNFLLLNVMAIMLLVKQTVLTEPFLKAHHWNFANKCADLCEWIKVFVLQNSWRWNKPRAKLPAAPLRVPVLLSHEQKPFYNHFPIHFLSGWANLLGDGPVT